MFPNYERDGLGKTRVISHAIGTNIACPVKQRHWPVSPTIEKIMFSEIDRMLYHDIIEESTSPWSSNVVLVRKGDKC